MSQKCDQSRWQMKQASLANETSLDGHRDYIRFFRWLTNLALLLERKNGSSGKSSGQLRLAWKAIHIGFADVGNRGQAQRSPRKGMQADNSLEGFTSTFNSCKIALDAIILLCNERPRYSLPGYSLLTCITAHILVTIVPSMYAVTYIGKPMCTAFQAGRNW